MKKTSKTEIYVAIGIAVLCLIFSFLLSLKRGEREVDVVLFGDSVIEGGLFGNVKDELEKITGMSILNAGFGGMTMCRTDMEEHQGDYLYFYSMVQLSSMIRNRDFSLISLANARYDYIMSAGWRERSEALEEINWKKVKGIVIEQCVNDYMRGCAIDNPDDKYDESTFAGALRTTIENVKKGAPNAILYLETPSYMQLGIYEDDCLSHDFGGGVLTDYVTKEMEIAAEYDVKVIDVFGNKIINKDNVETYTYDGLHPSEEGYKVLAEFIARSLKGNE